MPTNDSQADSADLAEMRRLSSAWTVYQKIIWPTFFLAFMSLFVIGGIIAALAAPTEGLVYLFFGIVAFALALRSVARLRFRFVDQLWLVGDTLLVRNRTRYDRFPVTDVAKVTYHADTPEHVTLDLSEPCKFGDTILFMPLLAYLARGERHPIAVEIELRSRRESPSAADAPKYRETEEAIQAARNSLPWDAIRLPRDSSDR
ncbi:MAG: hypothetical protein WCL32_22815 [Planctomycetota bacterium]